VQLPRHTAGIPHLAADLGNGAEVVIVISQDEVHRTGEPIADHAKVGVKRVSLSQIAADEHTVNSLIVDGIQKRMASLRRKKIEMNVREPGEASHDDCQLTINIIRRRNLPKTKNIGAGRSYAYGASTAARWTAFSCAAEGAEFAGAVCVCGCFRRTLKHAAAEMERSIWTLP